MKTRFNIIALAAVAAFLAGCQSANYRPLPRMAQQPQGIDGQWVDPNGIVSSFSNGRFETRTTDTNSLLAEGSYQHISNQMVEIELTSLLRNTTSRVNCALASQSQLNCTSSTGAQFTLVRRI
ncbi:outer membrane lipoprotein Omp10 [Hoeflea sp.]|nr:outer membrane lipoprotein Omp10 [Hoeflea sp.]